MDKLIEYLKYLFLGLVQGVTELLPISSSGHLVIFEELFNMHEPKMIFEIFTNTASLIALIIIFYKVIGKLIKNFFLYIFKKEERENYQEDFFYVLKLLITAIPIGIVGLLFKDELGKIKNLLTVGIALFVTGALLLVIYLTRNKYESHEEVTWRDSMFMGFTQMFAIIPGLSRSGSTIIGGSASRLSLKSIIKFSMLVYIIVSIPASFLGIYDAVNTTESINWLGYSLAFIVTLIATYITAKLILNKLRVDHFIYFSIYCLIVSGIAITLYFI
ncbi:MAG: undecaprenyl-diphosphate phosphatase [Acholeplasmatales bacterium]